MDHKIFGCKVNKYYTNQRISYINHHQKDATFFWDNVSYQTSPSILVASCIVTQKAKKKRYKIVFSELDKGTTVFLTGCAVLEQGKVFTKKEFFEHFPGLQQFQDRLCLLPQKPPQRIFSPSLSPYTRKFIVIQNGCDNHCSFCLSIRARGQHHSRPQQEIIQEVIEYQAQGGKEIVLTGVNIGGYGAETTIKPDQSRLPNLLEHLLHRTTIPRIRISSLGPEYVSEKLLKICKNPRILPYFHLSIQSFSDGVLKAMRRNYTSQHVEKAINGFRGLKRDDTQYINIGADIVCGFPGEGEEDFIETQKGIETFDITQLHAFPFSAHKTGRPVPATNLPNQIPFHIRKQRTHTLREIGQKNKKTLHQKMTGQTFPVLIEKIKDSYGYGWTSNYLYTQIQRDEHMKIGSIINKTFEPNNKNLRI